MKAADVSIFSAGQRAEKGFHAALGRGLTMHEARKVSQGLLDHFLKEGGVIMHL